MIKLKITTNHVPRTHALYPQVSPFRLSEVLDGIVLAHDDHSSFVACTKILPRVVQAYFGVRIKVNLLLFYPKKMVKCFQVVHFSTPSNDHVVMFKLVHCIFLKCIMTATKNSSLNFCIYYSISITKLILIVHICQTDELMRSVFSFLFHYILIVPLEVFPQVSVSIADQVIMYGCFQKGKLYLHKSPFMTFFLICDYKKKKKRH